MKDLLDFIIYVVLFLLLLVHLHDQTSDEVGGLLQGPPSPHIISGEAELLVASVRFALVGVCYISEEHARLSGPPHHRDTLGKERSVESVVAETQSCQNHLAGPVKKVVCILLLSGFQRCFDDGGNGCWLMVALQSLHY